MALKDIFKRKPGGTFVGNLIRGAVQKYTGGALGNGALKISQDEYDLKALTDADYQSKYGKTKTGVVLNNQPINKDILSVEQQADKFSEQSMDKLKKDSIIGYLKKYWYIALLPAGLLILAIFKLIKRK